MCLLTSLVCLKETIDVFVSFWMQRYADNPNQLLDASQAPLLKSPPTPGQPAG